VLRLPCFKSFRPDEQALTVMVGACSLWVTGETKHARK